MTSIICKGKQIPSITEYSESNKTPPQTQSFVFEGFSASATNKIGDFVSIPLPLPGITI
jgi:hypothetical protein